MKKRFLGLLLCLGFAVGLFPFSALAAETAIADFPDFTGNKLCLNDEDSAENTPISAIEIAGSIQLGGYITETTLVKPEHAKIRNITWYRNGKELSLPAKVTEGKYEVRLMLKADKGYAFTYHLQTTILGETTESPVDVYGEFANVYSPIVYMWNTEITFERVLGNPAIGSSLNNALSVNSNGNAVLDNVAWSYNGKLLASPSTAEMGKYQALITLKAKEGYKFTDSSVAVIFGKNVLPYTVSEDGQYAYYLSDSVTLACDHSGNTNLSYEKDSHQHWQVCSVCGKTYGTEEHSYGAGNTVGGKTTYTCTDCGYQKVVNNDKEVLDWLIISTDPLTIGSDLPVIALSQADAAKMTLNSCQWKAGTDFGTATSVSANAAVESGKKYYVTVTCTAKNGYCFCDETKPAVKICGVTAKDDDKTLTESSSKLTATVEITPVEAATATVTLPELTAGKKMSAIFTEIDNSKISKSQTLTEIYIIENGVRNYYYKDSQYHSDWQTGEGSVPYSTFKNQTVKSGAIYKVEIKLLINGAAAFVPGDAITIKNSAFADSVATVTSKEGVFTTAIYSTTTDGKTIVNADLKVDKPISGNTPAATASGVGHFAVGTPSWSGSPKTFAVNTAYTVTLTLTPEAGYQFDDNATASVNGYPAASVRKSGDKLIVTYTFPLTGKITQRIKFNKSFVILPNGGSVTNSCTADTKVTYSILEGSDVAEINADTGVVTAKKTGTVVVLAKAMESADYTGAEATYILSVTENSFTDVKETDYFYDAVQWAAIREVTQGTDATHFSPNDSCTRAQIVTFLWRAAGCPEPVVSSNPFTDVTDKTAYYYKAVLWAVEKEITNGVETTLFGVNNGCTRGQVVTFLYRYAKEPAIGDVANPFTDVKVGTYYEKAVLWAVSKNITKGTSDATFSPEEKCTRGQIVTFLYRDLVESQQN